VTPSESGRGADAVPQPFRTYCGFEVELHTPGRTPIIFSVPNGEDYLLTPAEARSVAEILTAIADKAVAARVEP
jgi:hypothetical protein